MEQLRTSLKEAKTRAYGLKTKKAQAKAWARVREIEREILTHLYAQRDAYAVHSVKGTVLVDNSHCMSEHLIVKTPYGILHPSPTSDVLSKSWYAHTCCVEYTKGQEVVLELHVDVDSARLCLELIPKRIVGGTLNETKYAELDKRTDLAFFKHSGADGVTGLFSTKAGA